jgi:hypothetical protein
MHSGNGAITAELVIAIITLAVAMLALGLKVIPFLEERPHLLRGIRGPLQALGHWRRPLGGIALVSAAGYVTLERPDWGGVVGLATPMLMIWWFRRWIQVIIGGCAAGLLLEPELRARIEGLGESGLEALVVVAAVAEPWQGRRMIVRLKRAASVYRRRKGRRAGWAEGPYEWFLAGCTELHQAGLVRPRCADWRGLHGIGVWPTGGWQQAPTRERVQMYCEGKLVLRGVWRED